MMNLGKERYIVRPINCLCINKGKQTDHPSRRIIVNYPWRQRLFSVNYTSTCSDKSKKTKKERGWTEMELKYLALVPADERKRKDIRHSVPLETLTLKKSKNNQVLTSHLRPTSSSKRTNEKKANPKASRKQSIDSA